MSKQFFAVILLCTGLSSYVFSQQKTAGVIYYDQIIDLKAMAAQFQQNAASAGGQRQADLQQRVMMFGGGANMPEKITNKFEIAFNPSGAKFQKSVIDENNVPEGGEGAGSASGGIGAMISRFGGGGDREIFFNNSDKVTESFELNGEAVLLENSLGNMAKEAEKSDETRKIAGFECKKAVVTGRNGQKTTIWYTTDLSFKASPMPSMWTEGVVLGLETDRMKYFATSIEYSKVKDSEVAVPKKSRMITQEEYQKKMEEMRARFRNMGGGSREIRIQQQ
jgi:GLPGLI family protein